MVSFIIVSSISQGAKYYLANFFLQTAWPWKKLDRERGACPWRTIPRSATDYEKSLSVTYREFSTRDSVYISNWVQTHGNVWGGI